MYLSFFDEKPFFDELDFRSTHIKNYLDSICTSQLGLFESEKEQRKSSSTHVEENVHNLRNIHNLQNIAITGARSSGKTTQIYAFIATLFNTRSIYHLQNNIYENTFQYKSSAYHIEFSTKHFKNSDISDENNNKSRNKNIEFIRMIVETPNILIDAPKLIYIRDFDCCSPEIQKFFLRLIEKSMNHVRFILEVRDLTKLSEAILSRFLILHTSTPSYDDAKRALTRVFKKGVDVGVDDEEKIVDHAILYSHISNFTYKPSKIHFHLKNMFGIMGIYLSSFHNPHMHKTYYIPTYIKRAIQIKTLILSMKETNFFQQMSTIREILLEMFVNNVQTEMIQKYLVDTFIEYFEEDPKIQHELMEFAGKLDYDTSLGNKAVFFTEYLIIFISKKILFAKPPTPTTPATSTSISETEEVITEPKKRGRKKKVI